MIEKEKMLKQLLYDANYDKELANERIQAKDLCYQYNQLPPSAEQRQQEIVSRLLGKTRGAFYILAPFWCDYGYNIEIGKNFFANHNTVILDAGIMSSLHQIVVFIQRGIPLILNAAIRGLSMPIRLPLEIMSGLGQGFRLCRG